MSETLEPPQERPTDLIVRRALRLFDEQPGRSWTIRDLARCLGVSRADLGRRFSRALGRSPFEILCEVRMKRAARLLSDTEDGLAKIASEVGYVSEFAFSRAFHRVMRMRPGAFRKAARGSGPIRCAA